MKRLFIVLGLIALLFPQLVNAQGAGSTVINQTDIGPGDCSGAITTGGTAQNAFVAAKTRHGFQIQNLDVTEPLWFSITGTAVAGTQGTYVLSAGTASSFQNAGSYFSPIGFNTAISVIAATTGHKFSCTVF